MVGSCRPENFFSPTRSTIRLASLTFCHSFTQNHKNEKNLTFAALFLLVTRAIIAQGKYAGTWQLTQSGFSDPCARDQQIELKKTGEAAYHYGQKTEGCRARTQNYDQWKVEKREFQIATRKNGKRLVEKRKYECLVLEDDVSPVILIIKEKAKNQLTVLAEVPSGDTTKGTELVFTKQ